MAPPPKRATGANVLLRGRFQTQDGQPAVGNYFEFKAINWPLAEQTPLEDQPLIGGGREPDDAVEGNTDVAETCQVPLDTRVTGYWLKLLLDGPETSVQVGARGFIVFPGNPADQDTITLDGVAWTFVTSGPTGNQTQIGADLAATLAQLVSDLNASADANISAATYATYGDRLTITHDTADQSGNAFTLATSIVGAKLSGSTLSGGGLYRHDFKTANPSLPAMTVEVEHADLPGGSGRFHLIDTIRCNTMNLTGARSGRALADLELIGVKEAISTASAAGTPVNFDFDQFSQIKGEVLVDGICAANVTAWTCAITNNMDIVEGLCTEGRITGQDPGKVGLNVTFTARWSIDGLMTAARAGVPVDLRFQYLHPQSGAELEVRLHRVKLPLPSKSIAGPAGVEASYTGVGQNDTGVARSATVTLYSDRPDYANPA